MAKINYRILISLGFICLAAICNSIMDLVENENFSRSIFATLDQGFWYKRESWKTATQVFGWKADAWHIAKSLMIVFFCISVITYQPSQKRKWVDFIIMGIIWNLVFNLFYNVVFIQH